MVGGARRLCFLKKQKCEKEEKRFVARVSLETQASISRNGPKKSKNWGKMVLYQQRTRCGLDGIRKNKETRKTKVSPQRRAQRSKKILEKHPTQKQDVIKMKRKGEYSRSNESERGGEEGEERKREFERSEVEVKGEKKNNSMSALLCP